MFHVHCTFKCQGLQYPLMSLSFSILVCLGFPRNSFCVSFLQLSFNPLFLLEPWCYDAQVFGCENVLL